jgi:PTH1 family peptidyl-tRNA hydrolase
MRLIVGLGNPGTRYRDTPHNAGFQVCDRFAERHHLGDESRKFQGLFRRGRVRGEDIGVLKPQTYMNLSGESVGEAVRYLPIEGEDVILVFDEIDLPAGKIRIRPGGGAGGHRGPLSVIEHLATRQFPRIRLGVGRPERQRDPTGHLLTALKGEDRERFAETIERGVDALDAILSEGVDCAMNRYNGMPAIGEPEEQEQEEGDEK